MRQAVTNKLQTIINKEKTQKDKRTHKVRQELQEKKLINNINKKWNRIINSNKSR
jgi:hypothetical protein